MSRFVTIKDDEIEKVLSEHGAEAIIHDEKLIAVRIGPLRIGPLGSGKIFVSQEVECKL